VYSEKLQFHPDPARKLSANLYDIYHCRVYSEKLQFHPDPARKLSANLYDIYHCCVYSEKLQFHSDPARKLSAYLYDMYTIAVCAVKITRDDGQRNCPKHVEFHSKNIFEKVVHLIGFIIRNKKNTSAISILRAKK
jgi:hypothetical protein